MPKSLPPHPNVRNCTHIKVTGQRCGSPALRREFFCYFHTRVIKGVQQRVDMQLHSMALLEDCESIQLSIMHVVDGLIKGTLDATRARLIIQALRIAARNAKYVRFDAHDHGVMAQLRSSAKSPTMPANTLIKHPEFPAPPISPCGTDTPVHETATNVVVQIEALWGGKAAPQATQKKATQKSRNCRASRRTSRGAAQRTQPTAQAVGQIQKTTQLQEGAKESRPRLIPRGAAQEYERIQQAEAAIEGALSGNWRDLRTVFEFAGIAEPQQSPTVAREHMARQTGFEDLSSKH